MAITKVEELTRDYDAAVVASLAELKETIASTVESPIEELMVWGILWRTIGAQHIIEESFTWHLPGADPGSKSVSILQNSRRTSWQRDLHLQPVVRVGDVRYRIDIALEMTSMTMPNTQVFVAIECDGHDFHEKTKEQAERDKRRDRDLQSIGWIVARFTGAEIVRSPVLAAQQACQLANGLLHQRELAEAAILGRVVEHREGR